MTEHSNNNNQDGTLNGTQVDMEAIDWLTKNTNFPTFDEFRMNPDKYRLRAEEIFESADKNTQVFRKQLKKSIFYWKDQYRCQSEEQLQRVVKEEGFSGTDLEYEVLVVPIHGTSTLGDVETHIRFWPKEEFKKKGGIVAND